MTYARIAPASVRVPHNIFASPIGPQIYHDAPNDQGNDGGIAAALAAKALADKAEADKAAADKAAADKVAADAAAAAAAGRPPVSDADAKLLKENMKAKKDLEAAQARLAAFDGLDADAVKKLVADAAAAEEARKAAEEAAALARGDFDGIKKQMVDAHTAALKVEADKATTAAQALAAAQSTIENLTVGASFAGSEFIAKELVLTPSKTRLAYGTHFDVVDGVVVAYDKPRGSEGRSKIVDASGNSVGFEDALKKIVDLDPEKDHLIRAKGVPGAQSKTTDGKATTAETKGLTGIARIQAGLVGLHKIQPAT